MNIKEEKSELVFYVWAATKYMSWICRNSVSFQKFWREILVQDGEGEGIYICNGGFDGFI